MKLKQKIAVLLALAFGVMLESSQSFGAGTNVEAMLIASGPFKPDWKSLETQYQTPEWFRDAKFGIWAHWGPQCQPEHGDWYARSMYMEGSGDYKSHVREYGHPSTNGFKEVIHQWKAENFAPEKLVKLYKDCGAKYFMAMANHHDNFDNYNSKYQPWNSVAMGPRRDLIGEWAKAARDNGLMFGVSVHAAHAWSWYEPAQGADAKGPLAGVPYDGKLTKADGKGKWWDGLDPQDLYAQAHVPGKKLEWRWDVSKGSSVPDQAYMDKFFLRTKQLWDDYKPDLIYFDDTVLPLYWVNDEIGLKLAAHVYNTSIQWHGTNEAVINGKLLDTNQQKALVYDIERGKADQILENAWQTDTCIGSWHYNRDIFNKHSYKQAKQVIPMLVDIVSKNGNLMLNVPVRADGTIDDDEVKIVKDIGAWLKANGEAIYATRPWVTYGEGPSTMPAKGKKRKQNDIQAASFTVEDIRYTASKDQKTVYAIFLGKPNEQKPVVLKGFSGREELVKTVQLLSGQTVKWSANTGGLEVTVDPNLADEIAWVLKITLNAPATGQ